MNKFTSSSHLGLAIGIAIVAATNAHAQMALKGKLLFKDDFKTLTNYTSQSQRGCRRLDCKNRSLELEITSETVIQKIFDELPVP